MSLELAHRLNRPRDFTWRSVSLWALGLGLLLAIGLWLTYRQLVESQSSIGWASEIDLAKGKASDGKAGRVGMNERRGTGELAYGVTLVKAMPRHSIDFARPPDLPAPPAFDADLPKPPKLILERPTPPAERGKPEPDPKPATGAPQGTAEIAGAPGDAKETGGGAGMGQSDAAAQSGSGQKGAGNGRGGKGITGTRVAGDAIAAEIQGWTLVGSEGAFDGSEPSADDPARARVPWQVYYAPDGTLMARWTMLYARKPHAPLELVTFNEKGTWTIQGDNLCQKIPRWGYGLPVCFQMHKVVQAGQTQLALYYEECGGLMRCYAGRLGPEGVIRQGKVGFDD